MLLSSKNKGFTLVELMVTTSIFVFITALLVAKFGVFNQGVLLTNLAYDVALTIRTAQTYGLSVQNKDPNGSPDFKYAYGVYFDKATDKNKQLILFADSLPLTGPKNMFYDGLEENISTYNIKRGAKVIGFCAGDGCSLDTSINRLDISFLRPNPTARICTNGGTACTMTAYAKIFLQALDGSVRSVTVRQTGQVSIDE